jgi:Na+-transporting NADH:ubiquinone oxidoreductase subunit NqrD
MSAALAAAAGENYGSCRGHVQVIVPPMPNNVDVIVPMFVIAHLVLCFWQFVVCYWHDAVGFFIYQYQHE